MSEIERISQIKDSTQRVEEFKRFCDKLLKEHNVQKLIEFAQISIASNDTVASRPSLEYLAKETHERLKEDEFVQIAKRVLDILGKRSSSFVESANIFRQNLSRVYEDQEEFTLAAKTLADINLDTKGIEERFSILVHIATLFLEDEESAYASTYVTKADLLFKRSFDVNTRIRHELCKARCNDYRRKFLEASRMYYQVSHLTIPEDTPEILRSATIACILAPAGPQRSRMLAQLFKDERTHVLEIFSAMEKMYLGRIIRLDEEEKIKGHLLQHHKAETAEGFTVLKKAIIEHNLEAASRIYNNITFEELGLLLDVTKEKAEEIAAKMITEDRLSGFLDQVDKILYFEEIGASMKMWDGQIEEICLEVGSLASKIVSLYPALGVM